MYDDKTLTGRLNTLYTESGLSQDKFAESCGVSGSAMQNYLKGTRDLPAEKIAVVCNNYHVSADWLLGLSDVRKPSADLRGVCEFTSLSAETIEMITKLNNEMRNAFEKFIDHYEFYGILATYCSFLELIEEAKVRFTIGTPGANVGIGMANHLEVNQDGTVTVSSVWQALSYLGQEIGFLAGGIAGSDRLKLWERSDNHE